MSEFLTMVDHPSTCRTLFV